MPQSSVAPSPPPLPIATPPVTTASSSNLPVWIAVIGVAILAVVGGLILRHRRAALAVDGTTVTDVPTSTPTPAPAGPVRTPPIPLRPLAPPGEPAAAPPGDTQLPLVIELRPVRAGVNLLSATVESEIVITNPGSVAAENVQVEVRMIGAHGGQDADLALIAREPVSRPAVAPFVLAPGAFVRLSAVAALPRASIVPLDAGGRPIFVPIVTVKLDCAIGTASVRQAAAYAIGVERVDSARLAPFRLDGPPRTFDTVAARPHPIA